MKDKSQLRYARVTIIALFWVCIQSALGGYIHGNSLGQIIANHMPLGGFFFLILLLSLNPLVKKLKGSEFSPSELAIIWIMITSASAIPGYGMMEFLFPYIAAPLYFSTPENQWTEVIIPKMPDWSYLSDKRAVGDFFTGTSGSIPWVAWLKPAGFWIAFSLILFFSFICWSVILRKQWIERERYVFPLVQVPAQLIQPGLFIKNRLIWIGISIALIAHLLNGFHNYFPAVPYLRLFYSLGPLFPDRPWNALVQGWPLEVLVYFSVIGVTYFLQLDVALSLWFFFTFYKFQQVIFSAFSLTYSTQHQVMGADVVLIFFIIWMSRYHLKDILSRIFTKNSKVDDSEEPLSFRFAVTGLYAGLLLILIMCMSLGMSLWVSALFIFLMWSMATVVGWMVANAGMLLVNVGFSPFWFITTIFGTRKIDNTSLIMLGFDRSSIPHWSSESLMPYALQNFKLSDSVRVNKRKIPPLIALSISVAVIVSFYASLQFIHRQGAENLEYWVYMWVGRSGLEQANYGIQFPYGPNITGTYTMIFGGAFMSFLLFMRHRFLWWPLHPIGYAIGVEYASYHLWFSTLAGWLIKSLVLKFGGLGTYRRYRPLFLGLIVGEYFMAALWSFVGIFTRVGYWGLPH